MSSSTNAYFFKAENSTLTLEEIRSKGYIAGETRTGFIEVTFFDDLYYWTHKLGESKRPKDLEQEEQYRFEQKKLEDFLIKGLKENTPRLMHCESSTFGGGMDESPILKAYNVDGTIEKAYDNYRENSSAEALFFKEYKTKGYFSTVGFIRDTQDHKTDEQKEVVRMLEQRFNDQEYNDWKNKQSDLDIGRISLLAISTAKKGKSMYSYGESEYDNLDFMERFVKEHYNA